MYAYYECLVSDVVAKGWEIGPTWKHCINTLPGTSQKEEGDDSERPYAFESIWSIPTRRRPVPSATVRVLFHVEPRVRPSAPTCSHNSQLIRMGRFDVRIMLKDSDLHTRMLQWPW